MTDTYLHPRFLPPSCPGERFDALAVTSDRPIIDAAGKLAYFIPDSTEIIRTADQYHIAEGFRLAGFIMDGYQDIPAGQPFWIVTHGPAIIANGNSRK